MNLITPIAIGFLGSMHCIGMCGPIAMALPVSKYSGVKRMGAHLLYNSGRLLTYGLLGMTLGLLGKSFYVAGVQRQLSVFLGVLLLVGLLLPSILPKDGRLTKLWYKLFGKLYSELSFLLKKGNLSSLFGIGILNGLLPCGLVYLGLAGALAQERVENAVLFMLLFGVGTLPMMMGIAWSSKYISLAFRNKIKRMLPIFVAFFALLLILRGLNLGVYLSPPVLKQLGPLYSHVFNAMKWSGRN